MRATVVGDPPSTMAAIDSAERIAPSSSPRVTVA